MSLIGTALGANPAALYIKGAIAAAVLLAVAAAEWWVYSCGEAHVQRKWDAQVRELAAAYTKEVDRLGQVNRTVEVRYMDRVHVVQAKAETIIREVPKYVTQIDDSRCTINAGFVRLHDAAAQNRVPEADAVGPPDDAASGVALSNVATVVAENYGTCNEIREQLIGLQEWARGVAAAPASK